MRCPYCTASDIQVLETRDADDAVRRRRICRHCEQRFTTYERIEELPLTVTKRDGREEEFNREKLLRGLLRATTKRPVTIDQVEQIVDAIAAEARSTGGTLAAGQVGELALASLRELDPVAYVRFASVYRAFENVGEFEAELGRLESAPLPVKPSGQYSNIDCSPKNKRKSSGRAESRRRS